MNYEAYQYLMLKNGLLVLLGVPIMALTIALIVMLAIHGVMVFVEWIRKRKRG